LAKADITPQLASRLVSAQFPQWADLPVSTVELDGWDNTTFRLGEEMSVRIPSHQRYVPQVDKEHRWLPVLAPQLPVPIPRPIGRGRPGCGVPTPWSIYEWVESEPAAIVGVTDHDRLADDLARFLGALRSVATDEGPRAGAHSFNRGGPVSVWDEETRSTIDRLAGEIDVDGAVEVWDAALAAPWAERDVWVHGDVTGSNLLLRDDRLCGVIDFGCAAVGDPACDLTAAWTLFSGTSRARVMKALPFDEGTWARARGWALWKALIAIPGRPVDDTGRTGGRFGWRWDALGVIEQVIA
jgi:aminoglycoside phosphotransferase (APT) family kinase protein